MSARAVIAMGLVLAVPVATVGAQPTPARPPSPAPTRPPAPTPSPAPAPTPSQADLDRAADLAAQGTRHFDLAEYDQAIAAFKEAYRLVPEPLLLFDIAQALRKQRACADARTFYQSYLRAAPDADNRATAEKWLAEMDACVQATPPPDHGAGPLPDPHAGPPGGDRAAPRPRPGRTRRLTGLATMGAGVLVAGAGVYFSTEARAAARDVEQACAEGCAATDVLARDADGKAAQRDASICYGVATVAVAAGAALVTWGWLADRRAAEHVVVAPTATGAVAQVRFAF